MEHRFREDENELPYLVSQKRDDGRPRRSEGGLHFEEPEGDELKVNDILESMNLMFSQFVALKMKVMSFLGARDCTGLWVEGGPQEYSFTFTRQNEYVKTTHEFIYWTDMVIPRVFKDCYSSHDHSGLEGNPDFKRLIKATGFEYIGCRGGYVCDYDSPSDEFTMSDEIDVHVRFRVGSKGRAYDLDLDRMELAEDYFEFDL